MATSSEPVTMIGDRQLGSMWREDDPHVLMPMPTQACTNSRLRMARNSPRTSRAIGGHDTTAIASHDAAPMECSRATSRIAKRKDGMVWKNSVKRISTSSTRPPK